MNPERLEEDDRSICGNRWIQRYRDLLINN
jgi:hypothetical protein